MMKSRTGSFRTMEGDDDFPAYYHHYARTTVPPRRTFKPITWLLTMIFSLLEAAASRFSFGTVVMAILVVVVVQFRANIVYSLQSFRERIRGLGLLGIMMEVWYTLRSFVIMCWQRLGYFWTSSKERTTEILEGSSGSGGVASRGASGSGSGGGIRRRTNAIPELEEPPTTRPKNGVKASSTTPRIYPQPTEPSFRNESDYPPGWLVFHPVLGVIEKTKADEYDAANTNHEMKDRKELKKPMGAVAEDEKKEECARLPAGR